jgi:hypothetical protein
MTETTITPPLRIRGQLGYTISSLDQATAYLRAHLDTMDTEAEGVLRRLERAGTAEQAKDAANAFRAWLDARGLLMKAGEPLPDDRRA